MTGCPADKTVEDIITGGTLIPALVRYTERPDNVAHILEGIWHNC